MALSSAIDDSLPSIRRPSAWETPGRCRQITSPDADSTHSSDELSARMPTAPVWRSVHSFSAGAGGRRPVIEV